MSSFDGITMVKREIGKLNFSDRRNCMYVCKALNLAANEFAVLLLTECRQIPFGITRIFWKQPSTSILEDGLPLLQKSAYIISKLQKLEAIFSMFGNTEHMNKIKKR